MSSIKLTADSGGGTVELKAPATTGSNAAKQFILEEEPLKLRLHLLVQMREY